MFTLHGAMYLALKTEDGGEIQERAQKLALWLSAVVAVGVIAFLAGPTSTRSRSVTPASCPGIIPVAAMGAAVAVPMLIRERLHGWAFVATTSMIALTVLTLFLNLYPRLLVSSIDPAFDITIDNAKASDLTLTIMSWAALVFVPIVLAYQSWSYWVFRHRISRESVEAPSETPLQVIDRRLAQARPASATREEERGRRGRSRSRTTPDPVNAAPAVRALPASAAVPDHPGVGADLGGHEVAPWARPLRGRDRPDRSPHRSPCAASPTSSVAHARPPAELGAPLPGQRLRDRASRPPVDPRLLRFDPAVPRLLASGRCCRSSPPSR
jgi:hypothetical protein